MIRGGSLAASMSRYLIDRIEATANIETMFDTEIVGLGRTGDGGLDRVRWRNRATGEEDDGGIAHVFLFVGADPATEWLRGCGVAVDRAGFVVTGGAVGPTATVDPLQSSVPGVFAVGDVRAGSVKRVGAAIGEGAQVVPQIHAFLARANGPADGVDAALPPASADTYRSAGTDAQAPGRIASADLRIGS